MRALLCCCTKCIGVAAIRKQGLEMSGKAPARLLTLGLDARENSIGFAAQLKRPAPHNYIFIFSSTAADEMLTSIIDPGHHF